MSNGSRIVPLATTASTPIVMPSTAQMIAAPMMSEKVTGAAAVIAGTTLSAWLPYETRSREMNRRFIISAYRTGSGRSSPNSCLTAATVSGVGLRPASERVGSTPGIAKKIRNVSTEIAKSTTTSPISLRMMKANIVSYSSAHLGPRIEGVAQAVAEHVQREHVSTIMIPGTIATRGRV